MFSNNIALFLKSRQNRKCIFCFFLENSKIENIMQSYLIRNDGNLELVFISILYLFWIYLNNIIRSALIWKYPHIFLRW